MVVAIVFVIGSASVWVVGGQLSSPVITQIGSPPKGRMTETVIFNNVHGWYFPAKGHKACILLMHGIKSNRSEMVSRTDFLVNNGYSSLAIDLQAHGETPGEQITFGYQESKSAHAAVKFLKNKKSCKKTVALGSSLGGAASILGQEPIKVDGYILEGVYPSIETAVRNRLSIRLGTVGEWLAPLFYEQIPLRLGVQLDRLKPSDAIRKIRSPVLIMNGTHDKRTTIADAKRLFDNAPEPKVFVEVKGAAHVNLYNYNPNQYKQVVLRFLNKYIDGKT